MNLLIVGGTGPIGAYAALYLNDKGYQVTIASRNQPPIDCPLSVLEWVKGNYLETTFSKSDLSAYDAIVFAAGSDMRHVPAGEDADQHYLNANAKAVPAFASLAKEAGVKRFIHIGSFYPQVVPEMIETDAYVRSRHLADKSVCKLSDDNFTALSLNAPFVVGYPRNCPNEMFTAYVNYAKGRYPEISRFGPSGGSNFMSVHSLAEAIEGGLSRGEAGKSYLLGDENLSFAEFFELFHHSAGNMISIPELDQEHPMLPDIAIIPGRGSVVSYQPNEEEAALLGYSRRDVKRVIQEIVDNVTEELGEFESIDLSGELSVEPELQQLAYLYARAMDSNEPDILERIMSDEIVIQGPGFNIQGLQKILNIPATLNEFYRQTNHSIHQQLARIDGDIAVAETYCSAKHLLHPQAEDADDRIMVMEIRYQDKFSRSAGSWKFTKRSLIVDWMEVRHVSLGLS